MAWTTPMTFTDGSVLTAAQLNTHLRDNLLETGPAKAISPGGLVVTSGANQVVQRTPAVGTVLTSQSTTSTSYVDLTTVGPSVTVTHGSSAWVFLTSRMENNTSGGICYLSYSATGANTLAADDTAAMEFRAAATGEVNRKSIVYPIVGLVPGTTTFTAKYRVGGASTGTFAGRTIGVIPL